ncbi:hypothetical protein GJ744_000819 [Endocarpon pusillum]|uniref:CorA-like transporter domain-containing protein n=1 Tax=Endocarpon pusillum TaxID=364733 RepID=A0A8H7ANV3_9EURO|nr:hypothetical protein GJ744_000819 [Endocarpon pusillum]
MDELARSYERAPDYPKNLLCPNTYQHVLDSYFRRLKDREDNLFCSANKSLVYFWQFNHEAQGFWDNCVHNRTELNDQLRIASSPQRLDPRCRFVFLHAPNSRERLYISCEICALLLTYHQVMPSFLDFMLSYGRNQHAQDFHFSGLRHESRVAISDKGLEVPELGRSGRKIELCYSFRSVETSSKQTSWPWSIRQAATYHSFDLESGQSVWIVLKGDQLMRERLMSATKAPHLSELRSFKTLQDSFCSSLATHLVFCDWSVENWRWYINFLEEEVQAITRTTVDVAVSKPIDPISAIAPFSEPTQGLFHIRQKARTFSFGRKNTLSQQKAPASLPNTRAMPPGPPEPPQLPPAPIEEKKENGYDGFSFRDLQRIEFIEEQTNETLLVLKTNVNVMIELKEHYAWVMKSDGCPQNLKEKCRDRFARFESRVASLQHDLQMERSRIETLLRLLADRKTLLYGILQFRSMEASKMLAEKAQHSAAKMEIMTQNMHEIAFRTKQETYSMKVITLVTLFFLPGTFTSTLMSTDIIRFQKNDSGQVERIFSLQALQLFFAITVPLMIVSFFAWGLFSWITFKIERKWFASNDKADSEA